MSKNDTTIKSSSTAAEQLNPCQPPSARVLTPAPLVEVTGGFLMSRGAVINVAAGSKRGRGTNEQRINISDRTEGGGDKRAGLMAPVHTQQASAVTERVATVTYIQAMAVCYDVIIKNER